MMEDRYIATVDLGTSKIAFTVAKVTGADVQILYYKEQPSAGIRYGAVFNPSLAATQLKKVIADAETQLSIKILQVVIGMPRSGVRQEVASAQVPRMDPTSCISQEEVDAVKNIALDSYPLDDPDTQKIYGAVAQSFSADDMIGCSEEEIIGMPSAILAGNFKVFVGPEKAVSNIDILLNQTGVAPARKVFLPGATADAVLTREEKDNGVALIEIGAGVTSLTIYQRGLLRYYFALPFGGRNITTDIKYECGFNEHLAENIKLAYGACQPDKLLNMSDKILQIENREDGTAQQLPVKYLSEIIHARMCEILEAVLFKIQESGYADRLRNGVVLTGGSALLTGCSALIKERSGYSVRIGFPRTQHFSWSGCPGIGEPAAVSSVAMLLEAKSDEHLNCTTEYIPPKAENEEPEEPAGIGPVSPEPARETETSAPGQDDGKGGNLFNDKEWGEPQKPEKPKKKRKESWLGKWTKQQVKTVEGTLTSFYEQLK